MLPINIKRIRALKKMTQAEFVEFIGFDTSIAMQKSYEAGKTEPGVLYMQKLTEISGLSTSELFTIPVKSLRKRQRPADNNAIILEILERVKRIEKRLK